MEEFPTYPRQMRTGTAHPLGCGLASADVAAASAIMQTRPILPECSEVYAPAISSAHRVFVKRKPLDPTSVVIRLQGQLSPEILSSRRCHPDRGFRAPSPAPRQAGIRGEVAARSKPATFRETQTF